VPPGAGGCRGAAATGPGRLGAGLASGPAGFVSACSCAGGVEGCRADRGARGEKAIRGVVQAERCGHGSGGGCVLGVHLALDRLSAETEGGGEGCQGTRRHAHRTPNVFNRRKSTYALCLICVLVWPVAALA
jgi:hypothetical protein